MGYVEKQHTAFAGGRGRHQRLTWFETPSCLRRVAGRSGGGPDRVTGRVGWRGWSDGGQGQMAGRVGLRAGSEGNGYSE